MKENKRPSKQKFAVVNIREMKVIKAKQLEPRRLPLQKVLLQRNAQKMVGKAEKELHDEQIFIKKEIKEAEVKEQAEKEQQDQENEHQRIQPDRVKKLKMSRSRSSYCRFCSEPHMV